MNVYIVDTGKFEKIEMRDESGQDGAPDYIGNSGAFNDGQFIVVKNEDYSECTQETFEFWTHLCALECALSERVKLMEGVHGGDHIADELWYNTEDPYSVEYYEEAHQILDRLVRQMTIPEFLAAFRAGCKTTHMRVEEEGTYDLDDLSNDVIYGVAELTMTSDRLIVVWRQNWEMERGKPHTLSVTDREYGDRITLPNVTLKDEFWETLPDSDVLKYLTIGIDEEEVREAWLKK